MPSAQDGTLRIFAAGLAFMLLTLVPYLYGWHATPPSHRFLWTHSVNSGDLYTYLAQISRVRQGEVLVRNSFTIDEPNRGMLRPTYLLLGWGARFTGLPAIAVFHMGRILLGTLFFVALHKLAVLLLEDRDERRSVLVLAATSSGVGWSLRGVLPASLLPDTWQPELNVFMSLFESPHFTASLVLITVSLSLLIRAGMRAREGAPLLSALGLASAAGGATALLVLDHPFDALTMAVAAALVLAWTWRFLGVAARPVIQLGLVYCAVAAPAALWILARTHSDPVALRWMEQNVLPSPPLIGYLIGFGLSWPLAVWGWIRRDGAGSANEIGSRRRKVPARAQATPPPTSALWLLGIWALLGFVLVSLPVPYQRRLAEGWHLPVLVLAARGLGGLQRRFPRVAIAPFGFGTLLLAFGTGALIFQDLRLYGSHSARAYVPAGFLEGVERLSAQVTYRDAVLAGPFFSYLLSGLSGCHVVAGHRIQTVVLPVTARTIEEGLASRDPTSEPAQRLKELVSRRRLTHIVFDTTMGMGASPKALAFEKVVVGPPPGAHPVWANAEVSIHETGKLF